MRCFGDCFDEAFKVLVFMKYRSAGIVRLGK